MEVSYTEFMRLVTQEYDAQREKGECPVIKTLNTMQGKWKEHVLFFLCRKGRSRFGEIHAEYPQISKTMLSAVLKQLEADELILREQFNEIPPRTEYSLTESGKNLMPIFYEMFKWGTRYL